MLDLLPDVQPPAPAEPEWVSWSDEQLLDLRLGELKIRIPGTELGACVRQLYRELKSQEHQYSGRRRTGPPRFAAPYRSSSGCTH